MKQDPAVGSKVALLLIRRNLRAEKVKRDWHAVDQALDAAARASPDATEVVLVRAQALLAQEKAKEASALLEKSCQAQPAKLELWLARAELADATETGTKGLDILGEAEARLGDRVELRLARAVHWWRDARTAGQAPALLSKLEENTGHFSQDDQVKLWRGLGDLNYRASGGREGAAGHANSTGTVRSGRPRKRAGGHATDF